MSYTPEEVEMALKDADGDFRDGKTRCVETNKRVLAAALRDARKEIAEMRSALEQVRSLAQESQDCANGKAPHNPDGDGDEMCEEGVCYSTGWDESIKIVDNALRAKAPQESSKPEPKPNGHRCMDNKCPGIPCGSPHAGDSNCSHCPGGSHWNTHADWCKSRKNGGVICDCSGRFA